MLLGVSENPTEGIYITPLQPPESPQTSGLSASPSVSLHKDHKGGYYHGVI